VTLPRHLTPEDPEYPARLRILEPPPPAVSIAGELAPSSTVAIVGTRHPIPAAAAFARKLAGAVATTGAVVVSGGALGIDAAAHEGALAEGGRTWVVAGTGYGVLYPKEHGPLFERVAAGGGAVVWPFEPGTGAHRARFLRRNAVLVALSDVLVIVQARLPSGALNAAAWARKLERPRWVVCPFPWDEADPDFRGCQLERRAGARALTSIDDFLTASNLLVQPRLIAPPEPRRNPTETRVVRALSTAPRHVEEVVVQCGLPYPEVMTALLTLVLEDVLVEGPEGFFRHRNPP